jgi:hypothetical protein
MTRPLCIDLFCGLWGWGEAFAAEGWDVIGFDIVDMCRELGRPKPEHCQLVLQDVRTIDGKRFRERASVIVASPPCQEFASLGFPWNRLKISNAPSVERWEDDGGTWSDPYEAARPDLSLFRACFRIAEEAGCPLIVENVKNAQPYVGKASAHFGSYYLWGDVRYDRGRVIASKCLRFGEYARAAKRQAQKFNPDGTNHPQGSWFKIADSKNRGAQKNNGGSWFAVAHNTESGTGQNPVTGVKTSGHANIRDGFSHTRHLTSQRESEGVKHGGDCFNDPAWPGKAGGVKQNLSGPAWFDKGAASVSSRSDSRKAASAQIAKIPPDLAHHIARVFKP